MDFYQQPDPGVDRIESFIRHLVDHPDQGYQLVAEQDGIVVGFATLYFIWSTLKLKRFVVMNDLYVAASVRGQHVGEELFLAVMRYARDCDLGPVQWETAEDNRVARGLYAKMGGHLSPWVHYELD